MFPILHHQNFIYTRLIAYTWKYNKTLVSTKVMALAGKALNETYLNIEFKKPFVVNCDGISTFDSHCFEDLKISIIEKKRTIVLTNVNDSQFKLFQTHLGNECNSFILNSSNKTVVYGNKGFGQRFFKDIIDNSYLLEDSNLFNIVKDCMEQVDEYLESTPLKTNAVFDARKIIFEPTSFIWVTLAFVDKLKNFFTTYQNGILLRVDAESEELKRQLSFLSVSLRGSPFAAALNLLTDYANQVELVDHMGPRFKVFEEPYYSESFSGKNYIYVGDFTIGGTEIKIAEAFARAKGYKIIHAMVIGSYLDSNKIVHGFSIEPLIDLKSTFPELKYKFE